MADSSVLAELVFEAVPQWGGKVEKYIKEYEELQKPSSGIVITPEQSPNVAGVHCSGSSTRRILSGPDVATTPGVAGAAMPLPSPGEQSDKAHATVDAHLKKSVAEAHGQCRLDSKPDAKARFSSITSPAVMYDGESQHTLSELWTALNGRRGALRREMMALKRRQQLAIAPPPRAMPELIAADSDEGSGSEKDDDHMEHDAEMLRLRLKLEREKMKRMNRRGPMNGGGAASASMGDPSLGMAGLQFKRARMLGGPPGTAPSPQQKPTTTGTSSEDDDKLKELLESIDENLDKACKVTETVAFVWLKGDPYDGHLRFILGMLKEIAEMVEKSGFVKPQQQEKEAQQAQQQQLRTMAPPPSSRPEIAKKKSDITMRDAPSLRMMPTMEMQPERKNGGSGSGSSEDTVGPSVDSVRPPPIKPVFPGLQNPNLMEPDVLEVDDDDDEGIVC